MKKRVLFHIRYNGAIFFGWQCQIESQPSIQRTLEYWLGRLYDTKVSVLGASRTDRGVHAKGQLATTDLPSPRHELHTLQYKLNKLLRPDIFVLKIEPVDADFQIHHEVHSKVYTYALYDQAHHTPFLSQVAHWVPKNLSEASTLNSFLKVFEGTHDFRHFANNGSTPISTTRTVYDIRVRKHGPLTLIRLHGSGFLKQMVRNMVGATLEHIRKEKSPEDLRNLIHAPDRSLLISPAPAHALTLTRINLR